jgi:hypothetical protein
MTTILHRQRRSDNKFKYIKLTPYLSGYHDYETNMQLPSPRLGGHH